jgi:hypothetical protein
MTITTARTIRKHDNLDPIFFPADTDPQAMKAMNTQLIAGALLHWPSAGSGRLG